MLDAIARLRARVAPTIWQRRWAIVWNAGSDLRVDAEWLAYHLPRFGVDVVCVKVMDGAHQFGGTHGLNNSPDWLKPLRAAGLKLTGWGYCYGYDAAAEAKLAAELCRMHGLHAFVVDAEKEFEYDPVDSPSKDSGRQRYAASAAWLAAWRAQRSPAQLGVTSYGRADLHRLDWAAWAKAGARFCPQAYSNESVELAPSFCVEHAATYFDRRFVHPWIGLYKGATGIGTGEVYAHQLALAKTRGFGVYLADTATTGDFQALAKSK